MKTLSNDVTVTLTPVVIVTVDDPEVVVNTGVALYVPAWGVISIILPVDDRDCHPTITFNA